MIAAAPQTVSMRTRDGVRLDADVYRPVENGSYPVLLMRQPYGRRIASTLVYAHPSWYAAQGFVVVIQDVRGRGTSEGRHRLFANDPDDGADTVAWAASLPGSNGAVGMYGFSYQGTNQLLAACRRPEALKALAPAMIGWDLARDWAYENDAFCLAAGLGWATQMAAESARLAGDHDSYETLFSASRGLPLQAPNPARPHYVELLARYSHYGDWLANPAGSAYWDPISPSALAPSVRLPMLFVGGWYDSHLPGTLAAFKHFFVATPSVTCLVVGPWAHFPWGHRIGGQDFGPHAATDIDRLQVCWFNHWLKRIGAAPGEPPVRLFDMGGPKNWRGFAEWPARALTLHLAGSGRAAIDETDGALLRDAPAAHGCDYLVHDPWRPVPAVGGAYGDPPGPADRSAVDARPDVLTFTSERLCDSLMLAGDVGATLSLACDAKSFDVSCVLSRVTDDGAAMPLAQGYVRVNDATQPVAIPMRATCATIAPGERLRLSIAAACFPAYPVNPGTGDDPTESSRMDAQVITLGVRHGGATPSQLRLCYAAESSST
jgi:uncharacterized protein